MLITKKLIQMPIMALNQVYYVNFITFSSNPLSELTTAWPPAHNLPNTSIYEIVCDSTLYMITYVIKRKLSIKGHSQA